MRDMTNYLTYKARVELIRTIFGEDLTPGQELKIETLMFDSFMSGWQYGQDRYKEIMESLKKGEAA